jgi:hypothetical protein
MCQRRAAFLMTFVSVCGAAAMAAMPARAEAGPIYKDAERFSEPGYRAETYGAAPPYADARSFHPPRRVTGGPGYAGSEYGLGKPSFWGLGSRPDWGRSNQ